MNTRIPVFIIFYVCTITSMLNASSRLLQQMSFDYCSSYSAPARNKPQSKSSPRFTAEKLTEEQTLSIAFKIIEQHHADQEIDNESIDFQAAKNLELFDGANLLHILNRTSTKLGVGSLGTLLAQPITDIKELMRRQNIIRTILTHETLFKELSNSLESIKQIEDHLLVFWQENALSQEPFKQWYVDEFFPKANSINLSARWLEIFRRTEDIATLLLIPMGFVYINYLYRTDAIQHLRTSFHNFATQSQTREQMFNALQDIGFGGSQVLNAFVYVPYSTYEVAKYFRSSYRAMNYLHNKLRYFATALDKIKQMRTTILKNKNILADFSEGKEIIALFDNKEFNKDIQTILALLDTNTFHHNFSYVFSNFGNILAANKLIELHKNCFIPALAAIGKLDTFVSVARLYKEFSSKKITFCFAQYEDQSIAHIALTNFWSPLIPFHKVVPNSIELGGMHGPRDVVLTGQNTGGKSTVLKGIALSILLAQTITLAPATTINLTPFNFINTYMNITDNTKENQSLFAAEVARAKKLLDKIESLTLEEKSFTVIDEAFKGTGGEAEDLSYWYANKLIPFPNSICINATHYPKLTHLEAETNGVYKNYKVEVQRISEGKLIRPYKLEEGYTLYNIAKDILIEQGLM